jgi:hypothetical protein
LPPLSPARGKVDGVACDRIGGIHDGKRYELCVARGLPQIPLEVISPGVLGTLPFLPQLERDGLLPLAAAVVDVSRDASAAPVLTGTLHVSFIHTPVDAERVELPASNRLVDTGDTKVAAPSLR